MPQAQCNEGFSIQSVTGETDWSDRKDKNDMRCPLYYIFDFDLLTCKINDISMFNTIHEHDQDGYK